jgi:DNA-binding MarR family transcriptional regulator
MSANPAELTALITLVRRCFQRLRRTGAALHADLGVNTSMRAVLESLSSGKPQSVPQIAASKDVSRQHIQQIVDALLEKELVAALPNPRHRRSPVITLTPEGRKLFARIREREETLLAELASNFPAHELVAGQVALRRLHDNLQSHLKGDEHEPDT